MANALIPSLLQRCARLLRDNVATLVTAAVLTLVLLQFARWRREYERESCQLAAICRTYPSSQITYAYCAPTPLWPGCMSSPFSLRAIAFESEHDLLPGSVTALAYCRYLRHLQIAGPELADESVVALRHCQRLEYLDVNAENVHAKAVFDAIEDAPNLQVLTINVRDASPQELARLRASPKLRCITMLDTRVDDDGLMQIARVPRLEAVSLKGSGITIRGVDEFKKLRPDVKLLIGRLNTGETLKSPWPW